MNVKPAPSEQQKQSGARLEENEPPEISSFSRSRPSSKAAVYKSEIVEDNQYDDCLSEDGVQSPLKTLSFRSAPANSRPLSRYASEESEDGVDGNDKSLSSMIKISSRSGIPVSANAPSSSQAETTVAPSSSNTLRDYAKPLFNTANPSGEL